MTMKNLTVRLDYDLRTKLELIAKQELRPMANQMVLFIRQGIEQYLKDNKLELGTEKEYDEHGVFVTDYPALVPQDVSRS